MNIKSIVGSLAAMALQKRLDKGGSVEIPSLGIVIKRDLKCDERDEKRDDKNKAENK